MSDTLQTSAETDEWIWFDEHRVHEWAGRMYACDEIVKLIASGELQTLEDVKRYAIEHGKQMQSSLDAVGALTMLANR
jgi:hypothetical protein